MKTTKIVTFNAAAVLNLGPATLLVASSGAELAPVETKFDPGTERATLIFSEDLPAGSKATLRIGFWSALTDSMSGYYKSTWEKGIYALTQFEVRTLARSYVPRSGISCRFKRRLSGVREPKRLDVQWGRWCARTDDLHVAWRGSFRPKASLLSLQSGLPSSTPRPCMFRGRINFDYILGLRYGNPASSSLLLVSSVEC